MIEYILGDEIRDETDTANPTEAAAATAASAAVGAVGDSGGSDVWPGQDAHGAQLRYTRAVSDFGRLRLLDRTLRDERLDDGEAKVRGFVGGWVCCGFCGFVVWVE